MEIKEILHKLANLSEEEGKELTRELHNRDWLFEKPKWLIEELAKKEVFDDIDKLAHYFLEMTGCIDISNSTKYTELKRRHLGKELVGITDKV